MSEPYIAEIRIMGFNFAPRGYAQCDGQLLPISQYSALFSLLGTTYGGDGRTTFALPDLRGRCPIHMGTGPGLSPRSIGGKAGVEMTQLTVNEMPSHTHQLRASNLVPNEESPEENYPAASSLNPYTGASPTQSSNTIQNTGGQAHNNMQPYLAVNFIIALVGIYPSRN